METAPTRPRPHAHVRHDIQGLRALAVVAVILNHLIGFPVGGFVGVDVFFVISGFVITAMLLREHEKTGRVSFADFYRRRVRRIIPAAALVLVVTTAAAGLLYLPSRAAGIAVDSLWALFFSANWRFAATGTDYWSDDGFLSPVQHYWSLGVEEQYYAAWPVLLVAVFAFAAARRWTARRKQVALAAALAVLVVASFGWAMWETGARPTWAYFSTFSRAWELGIGALIAIAAPLLGRIPGALRPILGWAGLGGIAASLVVVSEGVAFPAPWAALPVLATALVVAAGTGGRQRYLWPLTNPVARYLGDISYSLYLWHFPVIILLAAVLPRDGVYYALVPIVVLILAAGSYAFVEDPLRRSRWLDPRPGTGTGPRIARVAAAGALVLAVVAALAVPAVLLV
ncbi:MAG: acyltransferase, partial [Naasia sp.]|nr:acyltransferase [Naasia sp.]